jgi:hypothetical protein
VLTPPGPHLHLEVALFPFLVGIMLPIVLGSATVVGWALATSKPAPDYVEADELLRRLGPPEYTDPDAQETRKAG